MIAPVLPPVAADIVGLTGSALVVGAFAYSNLSRAMSYLVFNLLNLVGAVLLGLSLLVHFNLASFVLEIVWFSISAFGVARALRRRGGA